MARKPGKSKGYETALLHNGATQGDERMAKVPGLSRRGSIWQFRVRVPEKLKTTIGKGEIVESLRSVSYAEAARLAEKIDGLQADAAHRIALLTNYLSADPEPSSMRPADMMKSFMLELRRTRLPIAAVQVFLAELFDQGLVGAIDSTPVRSVAQAMVARGFFEAVRIAERNPHRRFRPVPALGQAIETLRSLEPLEPPPGPPIAL